MIRSIFRKTLDRFPFVSLAYRNFRDQLDKRQLAIETPWGFRLAGHPLMASGRFEPEETKTVRRLLKEVDVFVNVGANVGYYCCHALSLGVPVVAVEPIARNLHFLLKNIFDNGWSQRAQVFPVALGASADILQMWGGGTGASLVKGWASIPESYVTQVPVLTLDCILGNNLSGKRALILVDVEGAEWFLLQGAIETLRHGPRPIWLMEISSTEHQPAGTAMNPYFAQTFERFFAEGYRAVTADENEAEIDETEIERVIEGQSSLRSHNFVFRSE